MQVGKACNYNIGFYPENSSILMCEVKEKKFFSFVHCKNALIVCSNCFWMATLSEVKLCYVYNFDVELLSTGVHLTYI